MRVTFALDVALADTAKGGVDSFTQKDGGRETVGAGESRGMRWGARWYCCGMEVRRRSEVGVRGHNVGVAEKFGRRD
mgnify:CR=1 FL=1